ncbi:hypothetical protein RY831_26900 [Noviherbaspirillum sp. CPCC 100848]|uniref:Uncharacterized protein n=1 Tax=Noviherbaspirillum album TaxID=3080276 RepID=A0ABU6JH98_9BURK|nr:hypothetical protein [Noviherbaspirillum sp. CPCC 100848]MEC4722793.1 hypothetical protein [Noviherbaspirillum sp. CPCC 100848]
MTNDEIRQMAKILKEQEEWKKLTQPAGSHFMTEYERILEWQKKYDPAAGITQAIELHKEAEKMRRQELIDKALNATHLSLPTPETLLSATETTAVKEIVDLTPYYRTPLHTMVDEGVLRRNSRGER